jgi:methionine sulfoxide reductase heme-binding subunit
MARLFPYWLWLLLSVPALAMMPALLGDDPRAFHGLLHPTGETAARLLIVTMTATPLVLLFKGWRGPIWLKKNRRYLGVAAFGYALLHTYVYLVDKGSLAPILSDALHLDIWLGWLAFVIFVPLAATSTDWAVRRLGTAWKPLQRWTYAAAVLTLLHWASLHDWAHPASAMVHFAPLAILTGYRLWWVYLRRRPSRLA